MLVGSGSISIAFALAWALVREDVCLHERPWRFAPPLERLSRKFRDAWVGDSLPVDMD